MSALNAETIDRHRSSLDAGRPSRRKGFRADVQGLRALAVLLVILYHSHVPGVSAGYVGVDVFFVISGFLITTQLVGEVSRTGTVRLAAFWGKRVRRLLPAAMVVVVATLAMARLRFAPLEVPEVVSHAWWTTFYGINYKLAAEGVNYQNAGADPSPLQHYWSLSVEEQFYVLWPQIVLLAIWLQRRTGRGVLLPAVAAVTVVSFAFSVSVTVSNPSLAYFALHTRAWELGIGGLIALTSTHLAKVDRRLAVLGAWAGFTAIIASAVAYSDSTAFPGYAALLPVAGAALVIASGCGGQLPSITRVVDRPTVQAIATVSYGWYLWHWPVLLLAPRRLEVFGWWGALALCGVALALAGLTYRYVERPTQASTLPPRAWLAVGAAMSAATIGLATATQVSLPSLIGPGPALSVVSTDQPADDAYLRQVNDAIDVSTTRDQAPRNLTPPLRAAAEDITISSRSPEQCLSSYLDVDQGPCVYGDPVAERTVVLFGDSHMEQWQPAFDLAGQREKWKVVVWTKSACPLGDLAVPLATEGRDYTECETWRNLTLRRIIAASPELVVVSQSDGDARQHPDEDYADASVATVDRLRDSGLDVEYLLDTEHASSDVPACLSSALYDVQTCGRPPGEDDLSDRRALLMSQLSAADVATTDPVGWQCTARECPPIVGDLLVYRDRTHLTATYSQWLAPLMQALLARHD